MSLKAHVSLEIQHVGRAKTLDTSAGKACATCDHHIHTTLTYFRYLRDPGTSAAHTHHHAPRIYRIDCLALQRLQ